MLAIMMSIANVQERLYAQCFTISLTHLPFISRLHLICSDPLPPVLFRLSFSPLSWCLGMVMPTKVRFLSALRFATNGFRLLTSFQQYPSFFLGTERDMGSTAATRIIRCSDRRLLVVPLFLAVLLHAASLASADLNYTRYRPVSSFRLERIQKHLRKINKPPILTIESPDGDVIDCVPKRKQPALDHPLLKDHKIQRAPTMMPRWVKEVAEGERLEAEEMMVTQLWHRNGTRCPEGTIPIRRSTVYDVLRAKSLYHFGKKHPRRFPSPLSRRTDAPDVVSGYGHEHAIAYTGTTEEMYGARATINVWDPTIQVVNEFSLSQIWILSGSFDGTDLNSIEAGWQVSPELYGDSRPRLFTYWTSDSYQATGCYNLLCAGFVQTNSRIAIGAAISPVSSYASNQYDITILIWKDPKVGNWWMSFGDNSLVGYWPAELFTHLAEHATMVEWGGEVVNTRTNSQHTSTQMGSGHFPGDGFGKASYFRNLEIVDTDNSLSGVQNIQTLAENTNCYDIKSSYSSDWGTYFYYGGPGRNPLCP